MILSTRLSGDAQKNEGQQAVKIWYQISRRMCKALSGTATIQFCSGFNSFFKSRLGSRQPSIAGNSEPYKVLFS